MLAGRERGCGWTVGGIGNGGIDDRLESIELRSDLGTDELIKILRNVVSAVKCIFLRNKYTYQVA